MTNPRDWHMAIGALAGALAASGHEQAYSYRAVSAYSDLADRPAVLSFTFPPGWVLPADVEAFAREIHEQIRAEMSPWGAPDPRTVKLLDLAERMVRALRRDETCIRGMLSERVLRDCWPAAIVAEASKRIDEANSRALRAENKCVIEIGKYHDRIASLKRTRAMRINPVDPRRPA